MEKGISSVSQTICRLQHFCRWLDTIGTPFPSNWNGPWPVICLLEVPQKKNTGKLRPWTKLIWNPSGSSNIPKHCACHEKLQTKITKYCPCHLFFTCSFLYFCLSFLVFTLLLFTLLFFCFRFFSLLFLYCLFLLSLCLVSFYLPYFFFFFSFFFSFFFLLFCVSSFLYVFYFLCSLL